jgi:hypothetical protein
MESAPSDQNTDRLTFPKKLFEFLHSEHSIGIIDWLGDNECFQIKNHKRLSEVLPRHFNRTFFSTLLSLFSLMCCSVKVLEFSAEAKSLRVQKSFHGQYSRRVFSSQIPERSPRPPERSVGDVSEEEDALI